MTWNGRPLGGDMGEETAWLLLRPLRTQTSLSSYTSTFEAGHEMAIHWWHLGRHCTLLVRSSRTQLFWVGRAILRKYLEMAGYSMITLGEETLHSCCWGVSGNRALQVSWLLFGRWSWSGGLSSVTLVRHSNFD